MQAVVITKGNLELQERPNPAPGPHDVIVSVRAAGINAADTMQRLGLYPAPAGWPEDIPGMEMAGVVSELGSEVAEPLLGRRVCAIVGGGAQATLCRVPAEHLIFLPDLVSWDEAGGFAETFTTAHDALVTQGQLEAGQRVLISGANGGVGTAAVQIAHALGAHVISVTRTNELHEQLRSLGADETITTDEVASIDRVHLILELVGAANLTEAQRKLAPRGRIVVIGVGGGARVEIDLLAIMTQRSTLTGSTLRSRSREEKALVAARVNESLVPWWTDGALRVPLARSFALHDATNAYEFFGHSGKFGKVVLSVEQ
jgi:NADPH:quinone reductase-like Zn-dependent oxidoreductase